ncbi:MAG: histidine kinase [Saprospiraceae bacterium]|nr:histidine kinase [Saprospiraceae bacterium]
MKITQWTKRIPGWVVPTFFIGTTILIVIFNDVFGEEESFVVFSLFFFAAMFVVLLRWIFIQTRMILTLKREKKQTELMHLKSQVNPHFFFNTLNNLYGLVGHDPGQAQQLILKLSDMMRYSIYEGQNELVELGEEITYLNNYIDLHEMRYHKKIEVRFKQDVEDSEVKVMPLLFIILLENAFKHGVENLREGAYVHIDLKSRDGVIDFDIENNFDIDELPEQKGIGIQNLKRRLELVYPKKHKLSLSSGDSIFKAHLQLCI